MTKKEQNRINRIMPNGIPRYIRCYMSNAQVADPYTIVFTGNYNNIGRNSRVDRNPRMNEHLNISMSSRPFAPTGVCCHGYHSILIDRPTSSHLGRKIKFQDLPYPCQTIVLKDYKDIWNIKA